MEGVKEKIANWLAPKLEADQLFLVEVVSLPSGKIKVFVDGDKNINIEQCAEISRFLEQYLDVDADVPDTYNLEVSSPGMTNSFAVPRQYKKRLGKVLQVVTSDGQKLEGEVTAVEAEGITLVEVLPELSKTQQKKNKAAGIVLTPKTFNVKFTDIKKTIIPLKFK